MFWKFGDFMDLDPDPDWSNFVDPDPDTINPDPHHCFKPYSSRYPPTFFILHVLFKLIIDRFLKPWFFRNWSERWNETPCLCNFKRGVETGVYPGQCRLKQRVQPPLPLPHGLGPPSLPLALTGGLVNGLVRGSRDLYPFPPLPLGETQVINHVEHDVWRHADDLRGLDLAALVAVRRRR